MSAYYGNGRPPATTDPVDQELDRMIAGHFDDAFPPMDFGRRVMGAIDAYEERRRFFSQAGVILGTAAVLATAAFAAAPASPALWGVQFLSATLDFVLGATVAVRAVAAAGLVAAIPSALFTLMLLFAYAKWVARPAEVRP